MSLTEGFNRVEQLSGGEPVLQIIFKIHDYVQSSLKILHRMNQTAPTVRRSKPVRDGLREFLFLSSRSEYETISRVQLAEFVGRAAKASIPNCLQRAASVNRMSSTVTTTTYCNRIGYIISNNVTSTITYRTI